MNACIGMCTHFNREKFCLGCGRTHREISEWDDFTEGEQRVRAERGRRRLADYESRPSQVETHEPV